jgi:NADPH:quinone reductase-like Zn-dependent oxidoreductase
MKAVVYYEFGPPEVLHLKEIDKPVPKDNELLIKVFATPVNFGDTLVRNFKEISPRKFHMPFLFWLFGKMYFGFKKPKKTVLGSEFVGEVHGIGKAVKKFKTGDQVFGYLGPAMGAYAEYFCMPENGVVDLKPNNMTFEEAASVPYGAIMALNLVRKLNIQNGQKLLINGASGGIGIFIVQLARHFGAEVTGVCSNARMELVRTLGADKVIDYAKDDFTKNGETYDYIFDILGKSSFSKCKSSLKRSGRYILVSFKMKQIWQMLWTNLLGVLPYNKKTKKVVCAMLNEKPEDLIFIKRLIESGKIRTIIDKSFPLEQAAQAHRYAGEGQKKGSVVITVHH